MSAHAPIHHPVSVFIAMLVYPLAWLKFRFMNKFQRGAVASETEMSMNDPQWGKRPNKNENGPPDFDEIVRKFNQKLNGLFGKKSPATGGSDGGNQFGGPSKAAMGGGFLFAIGLAVAVWLASGFYIVETGSKGIELRLGKYKQTTGAGLNWRLPYPIESNVIVNIDNVEVIEIGHRNNQKAKVPEEAQMLTEDQNIVDVQFAVQYTIRSPEDFLFNNKDPKEAVKQVAETAMREIVGKSKMDFVLYEGRADIGARAKILMQSLLDRYKTGIQISTVTMQNAQPPQPVQASFDDAVRAKQIREQLKNEGEAYANDILPKARGSAARLLEEAEGYKQTVVANAQGDASRFSQILTEYEKAPGVTRERIYLDVMQQIMQNSSKVLVDQKAGQNLLYLPLDKLMQMQAPAAGYDGSSAESAIARAAASAPQPAPAAAVTTPDARARDPRARENR
jgi:modulator of FtsH protease HflK